MCCVYKQFVKMKKKRIVYTLSGNTILNLMWYIIYNNNYDNKKKYYCTHVVGPINCTAHDQSSTCPSGIVP